MRTILSLVFAMAFVLTGCDEARYTDTPQSIGGYFVCKKAPEVEAYLDEVLHYAQDIRIISDNPNPRDLDIRAARIGTIIVNPDSTNGPVTIYSIRSAIIRE